MNYYISLLMAIICLVFVSAGNLTRAAEINIQDYGAIPNEVCDHEAPVSDAAIQNAINDAFNANGGVVVIPSGTFCINSILVKSGVTLRGQGGVLKLQEGVCSDSGNHYPITNFGHNNVTIENIIFDGNRDADNSSFTVCDGITITGDNSVVRDNTIMNPPDSGVMFSGSTNGQVINNRIFGGADVGIYVNDGTGNSHHENQIRGNKISDFPHGGISLKRITRRTIVSENTIYNCGNGITLEHASAEDDFSKDIIIANNIIRRIGFNYQQTVRAGIILRGSHYAQVIGNRIEEFSGYGILVQATNYALVNSNTVTFNTDTEATNSGITGGIVVTGRKVSGLDFGSFQNTIANNQVRLSSGKGIYLKKFGIGKLKNNIIIGNNVELIDQTALKIDVGSEGNLISSNILKGLYSIEYGGQNDLFNSNILLGPTSGMPSL